MNTQDKIVMSTVVILIATTVTYKQLHGFNSNSTIIFHTGVAAWCVIILFVAYKNKWGIFGPGINVQDLFTVILTAGALLTLM